MMNNKNYLKMNNKNNLIMNNKNNYVKLSIMALMIMVGTTIQAQTTAATIVVQTDATLGQVTTSGAVTEDTAVDQTAYAAPTVAAAVQGGAIRVIDNKGTKKYLQVQNGITQVTNTAPAGGIITTWQLGGQLVDDTEIDFADNKFSFDNVLQVDPSVADVGAPATVFTTAALDNGTNQGWALLVRDEDTGEIKKLAASDLIVSGQTVFTATVVGATPTAGELTFDVGGAGSYNGAAIAALTGAQVPLPTYDKVWVYRNGAKLIAGVDYTIATSIVTLVPNATAPNDWTLFAGDVIEIQYFK